MRPITTLLAMAAVLATAGLSLADSSTTAPAPVAAPAPAPAPADTNPLLMYSLDQIKTGDTSVGQSLSNAGIDIYGYLEMGYTANLAGPPAAGSTIPGMVFNTEYGNHVQMDQLDLTIAKAINFSDPNYIKRGWDVGGKFEFLYGYDGDSIHSSGLDFGYQDGNSTPYSPLYQADIEQAYVTLALHLGGAGDLKIKAGKFDTLLGEETINPTTNYLYSHTYSFGYMIPFTQTGVLAEYVPNGEWTFYGGVTRGWGQTLYDNNSNGVDFLGEVGYAPNSQWDFIVNLSVGPQDGVIGSAGLGDNNNYRTVVEPLITYTPPILNNALTLVSDTVVGYDGAGNDTNGFQSSGWFSEALYQNYVLNSYFSFTTREEYDYVGSGLTYSTGAAINPYGINNYTNFGDLTFGVKIIPFPNGSLSKNFYIRPEIREDLADHQVFNGKQYQTTVAIDAIYQF